MQVCFEGGVCAGKSTTMNNLRKVYKQWSFVPEYMSFLPYLSNPLYQKLNLEKRLSVFNFIEKIRSIVYVNRDDFFIDRCFLSICAFEYALLKLNSLDNFKIKSDFELIIPNRIIFFEVSDDVRVKRWLDRGYNINSILVDSEFNKFILDFFKNLSVYFEISFVCTDTLIESDIVDLINVLINNTKNKENTLKITYNEVMQLAFNY